MEDEFDNTPEFESEEEEQPEQVEPAEEGAEVEVDAEPEQEAAEEPPPPKHVPLKALEDERRKRQEFEEENRRLKEAQAQPQRVATPQTVEEIFDADPESTLQFIGNEIQTLQAQYRQNYDEATAQKIEELRDMRTGLLERQIINDRRQRSQNERTSTVKAEIYKAVPNFDDIKGELKTIATELGWNEKDFDTMLDPAVTGDFAARTAKALAKMHAKLNAGKTVKTKEVKQPTKVESAGNGGFKNTNTPSRKAAIDRAKESGSLDDWAALLD